MPAPGSARQAELRSSCAGARQELRGARSAPGARCQERARCQGRAYGQRTSVRIAHKTHQPTTDRPPRARHASKMASKPPYER
jgi:hypothetical protein